MTTDLNPNGTDTSGIEWLPTRRLPKPLSASAGVGAKVLSTAAETIGSIQAFLVLNGAPRLCTVDVYDIDANNPYGADATALAVPVADRSHAAGWVTYSSSGVPVTPWVNGYTYVDEVIAQSTPLSDSVPGFITFSGVNPTTAPQIRFEAGNTFVDGETGLASATITGRRIRSVSVIAVIENKSGSSVRFSLQLQVGGNAYSADTGKPTIGANSPLVRYTGTFYRNPATGRPWTNADAIRLSDGTDAFGLAVDTKLGSGDFEVTAIMLQFNTTVERRVATGFGLASASGNGGWTSFAMEAPADNSAANWAKANATNYLFVFYVIDDGGSVSLVGVDDTGIAGPGLGGWEGADTPVENYVVPVSPGPIYNLWVPAMFFVTSGVALGADRQPYAKVSTTPIYTGVGATKQGVATHATAAYGGANVLLSRPAVTPTADLIIRIRKVSDDSQVGGDMTISAASVIYNGAGLAYVNVLAASNASLASGTAYYLQFTSATAVDAPWQVCYVATDYTASTDGVLVAAGTIPGAATLDGTANALADILVNIQTAPTPPASLAASVLSVTQSPAAPGGPVKIYYAHLDWASTTYGVKFAYYELQRDQQTIAFITDESKSFFNDFESRRGIAAAYRVRAVRLDGATSDWTT